MKKTFASIFTIILAFAVTHPASAALQYWDINGATPGAGAVSGVANGNWSDASWSPNAAGDAATVVFSAANTAVFSAGTDATGFSTNTLTAAQAVGGITLEEGNVRIDSNTLTLNTGGIINIASGSYLHLGSTLAGSFLLTKNGDGRLFLGSGNTRVAAAKTTINAGDIIISATTGLSVAPTTLAADHLLLNGGTITLTNSATLTWELNRGITIGANGGTINSAFAAGSSTITATGMKITGVAGSVLTKDGVNEWRNAGAAAHTFEKLVVKAGRWQAGSGTALGIDGHFGAVPGSFMQDQITLDGSLARLVFAGGTAASLITLDPNRGITITANGGGIDHENAAGMINGKITGVGELKRWGATGFGLFLGGNNDFSGGFRFAAGSGSGRLATISGVGEVIINHQNALGSGTITWDISNAGLIAQSPGFVIPNKQFLNSVSATYGHSTAAGKAFGGVTVRSYNAEFSGVVDTGNSGNPTVVTIANATNTITFSGTVTNTLGISKAGTGKLVLSGNNTFTTALPSKPLISAGTMSVSADVNLGDVNNTLSINAGTLEITENATLAATRDFRLGTAGIINVATGKTVLFDGVLNGTNVNPLTKAGAGNLVLGGANTISNVTISAGLLTVASETPLGAAPDVAQTNNITLTGGGTLNASETFSLSAVRGIALGTSGGGLSAEATKTLTVLSDVTGTTALTLGGAGTVVLGGSQANHTGAFTVGPGHTHTLIPTDAVRTNNLVVNGTLSLNGNNLLIGTLTGSGTIDLTGGTLTSGVTGTGSTTFPGSLTGTGSFVKIGTNVLVLTNCSDFSGGLVLKGGTLNLDTTCAAGTGDITIAPESNQRVILKTTIASGQTVEITNNIVLQATPFGDPGEIALAPSSGRTMVFSGTLSGDGNFTQGYPGNGAGTDAFVSDNTGNWSGRFVHQLGILSIGHQGALGTNDLWVNPEGNANLHAWVPMTGGNAITNNVVFNTAATNANLWRFGGTNAFELSGAISLGSPDNLTRAIINTNVGGTTISGIISGGVGVGITLSGNSTSVLTLSAANTYEGQTVITSGILKVVNSGATSTNTVTVNGTGTLIGTGTILGATTVTTGGTINAGASPGTLTIDDNLTWATGGTNTFEISDATGTAGADPGWDKIVVNGALNITATDGNEFTIDVSSLGNTPANFDSSSVYEWLALTASGGIIGFDPAAFTVSGANFVGAAPGGKFIVATNGATDLVVRYVRAPAISIQPFGETLTAGSSKTFSVTASGTPTLLYQWKKDGNDLAGQTLSSYTINSLAGTDAGSYTVAITNDFGDVTSDVAVLAVSPAIFTNPAGQTKNPGDSVTFTVVADGQAVLTYQWKKNGSNIGGATESSYTINPVQGVDFGDYTVSITNSVGDATSTIATLIVSPHITVQPVAAQTNASGDNLTISVTATGSPTLSYVWKKGVTTVVNDAVISGADTDTLTFTGVRPVDAGTYTVEITNPGGTAISSASILSVQNAPVITLQPASHSIGVGSNTTFVVAYTGGEPFTFQWLRSGTNLADVGNITGSATDTLALTVVTPDDGAGYSVIITNADGAVTSVVATLTVLIPPAIDTEPSSQSVGAGTNAVFTALVSGSETLAYRWKKGVDELSNGGNIAGADTASLTISGISQSDAGSYSLVVTNEAGTATSASATLTVIDPPVITVQPPVSRTKATGTNVTFSATATGTAPLVYRWNKGIVPLSNGGDISGADTASLTLSNLTAADDGSYNLTVTNEAGSATSDGSQLTVIDGPVITVQPVGATNNSGTEFILTVSATGGGALNYLWKKNNSPVSGGNISGETTATLTIGNAAIADSGDYTVEISNEAASVTSDPATILVQEAAVITVQPVSVATNLNANVTFSVTATGNPLTYQWSKNGNAISGATDSSYSVVASGGSVGFYSVVVSSPLGDDTSDTVSLNLLNGILLFDNFDSYSNDIEFSNVWNEVLASKVTGTLSTTTNVSAPNAIYISTTGTQRNGRAFAESGLPSVANAITFSLDFYDSDAALSPYRMQHNLQDGAAPGATGQLVSLGLNNNLTSAAQGGNYYMARILGLGANGGTAGAFFKLNDTGAPLRSTGWHNLKVVITDVDYKFYVDGILSETVVQGTPLRSYDVVRIGSGLSSTAESYVDNVQISLPFELPTITTEPANVVANAGSTAQFSVTAGPNITTYQWQEAGENIPGATNSVLTLSNVFKADEGSFSVIVGNNSGVTNSASATLTVIDPYISSQPVSITNALGSTALFNVTANGTASLSYQWKKDGVDLSNGGDITGADTASLEIANAQFSDSAGYTVAITNSLGDGVISAVATLTVEQAPSITVQPQNQTVAVAANATFSVTADGSPLNYQWSFNGTPIGGATDSSLTIVGVDSGDIGFYSVVVSNSLGSETSSSALLSIADISLYAEDFDSDQTANWTVNSAHSAPPTNSAEFYFDYSSVGIPSAPNSVGDSTRGLKLRANMVGAVFSGLSVSPTGKNFIGDFTLSCDMWLNFNGPFPAGGSGSTQVTGAGIGTAGATPQWAGGVQDSIHFGMTADGGSSVDYRAYSSAAGSGYTPASGVFAAGTGTSPDARNDVHPYYAGVGGKEAPAAQLALFPQQTGTTVTGAAGMAWRNVVISKTNGVTTFTLDGLLIASITNSTVTLGGNNILFNYYDINTGISADANALALLFGLVDNIRVQAVGVAAPVIASQPTNVTYNAGTTATLTVGASSSSALRYQWRFNGVDIAGETGATLSLPNVLAADAGNYQVLVLNESSAVESDTVVLTVIDPAINTQPLSQTNQVFQSTTFTVGAAGTGTLAYQWKHEGTNIPGATASSYNIASTTLADAGDYTVVVSNQLNSVESAIANLTVVKASQTINFGPLANKTYGDAPFSVSATASSGLTVTFSILSGPATINIDEVTITGAGTVIVRASQAGDDTYAAAPNVDQSFVVAAAQPTSFVTTAAGEGSFIGSPGGTYTVQYADNLDEPINWQTLTSVVADSVTGVASFTDPTDPATRPERYYRITVP